MHPILFHLGPLPVRSYGTLVVLGFLVGLWRTMRVCARRMATEPEGSPRRIHPDNMFDMGIVGLMIGILCARILFVMLDWRDFAEHPASMLRIWEGGLALHGGFFGGILFMFFYCRWKRLSFFAVGDLCAVGWCLGYIIGRFGCLLNGCCYGGVCDLPWAIRFPDEQHPGLLTPPSHPTQIYASLFNVAFFFILTRWERRPRRDGEIFWAYVGLYGLYRFVVDFFRAGATSTYLIPSLRLTDTHILSLVMMMVSVAGILWLRRHRPAVQDAAFAQPIAPAATPRLAE